MTTHAEMIAAVRTALDAAEQRGEIYVGLTGAFWRNQAAGLAEALRTLEAGEQGWRPGRFDQDLDLLLHLHRRDNRTDVDTILGELEAAQFRLEDKPTYYDQMAVFQPPTEPKEPE